MDGRQGLVVFCFFGRPGCRVAQPHEGQTDKQRGGNPAAVVGERDGYVRVWDGRGLHDGIPAVLPFPGRSWALKLQIAQDYANFANPCPNSANLAKKKFTVSDSAVFD